MLASMLSASVYVTMALMGDQGQEQVGRHEHVVGGAMPKLTDDGDQGP